MNGLPVVDETITGVAETVVGLGVADMVVVGFTETVVVSVAHMVAVVVVV